MYILWMACWLHMHVIGLKESVCAGDMITSQTLTLGEARDGFITSNESNESEKEKVKKSYRI